MVLRLDFRLSRKFFLKLDCRRKDNAILFLFSTKHQHIAETQLNFKIKQKTKILWWNFKIKINSIFEHNMKTAYKINVPRVQIMLCQGDFIIWKLCRKD